MKSGAYLLYCMLVVVGSWGVSLTFNEKPHSPVWTKELHDSEYYSLKSKANLYLDITDKNNGKTSENIEQINVYKKKLSPNHD